MSTGLIVTNDTGWITPELSTNFELFNESSYVRYRRVGDIVTISGQVTPTATITADNNTYRIFSIPSNCCPNHLLVIPCQGSSQYIWCCIVSKYGTVAFWRYRRGSSAADCPAGAWLPFDCSFMVGGYLWSD